MKITSAHLLPRLARREGRPTEAPSSPKRTGHETEASPSGLAESIRRDGGLGFLQARLEEKLSERFAPVEGDSAPSYESGAPDLSPEAVADRIVGFALGLRGVFDRQNADLSVEERQNEFEAQVRRGIADGFGHARRVLGDLDMLDDDVRATTDRTWQLVQERLAEHFSAAEPLSNEPVAAEQDDLSA